VSRARRKKPRHGAARYLAPAAFLLGVTIAVLLIRSGLDRGSPSTTVGPVTTHPATVARTTTKRTKTARQQFYTVQTGDTFGSIATKVGISVEQLQALNPGVSSNALQVGQKLRVK
jgi:LysM domain